MLFDASACVFNTPTHFFLYHASSNTITQIRDVPNAPKDTSFATRMLDLPNGQVPKTGRLFRNPTMAAMYQRVIHEAEAAGGDREAQIEAARKAWYRGFVAEAIDRFCRTRDVMDTSGRPHRGVLTADDMAKWTPHIEAPITYD